MSTTDLPKTIKSLIQPDIHSTKLILTTIPLPTITPGTTEHLIRIQSTSPCSGELLWAANFSTYTTPNKLQVPCYDLSGTVVLAPPDSPFPVGTEVYTRTSFMRPGNAREYSVALQEELARKPKNMSWEEAACIPLSAFTAWQALFVYGGLRCLFASDAKEENGGKTVLVDAASGGVGVMVVQFARAGGVGWVVGICSGRNRELVGRLGADEIVDYGEESIEEWGERSGRKVDLVVDMEGGKVVSVKEDPNAWRPKEGVADDVEGIFFVMEPEGWQLEETARLIEMGQVRAVVDSVWPLSEFEKAFAVVEGGHAKGKVVINVRD
ncbi:hypothetical protein SBOR_4744 [Sclerotinia borealis F-4128]|uniref:Enoyl reductase (ER) domain-containing protein n=1 Tax=Sclerotinia borealis (strain F-4128) TaxID=1432307 RepID=W9CG28_SCLBF|nr:hypothetical protein SBOR_4744 [Sclerotinia borealis F-4128]